MKPDQKLLKKLEERNKKGTMRSLSCFEGFKDFYSNDYLGLAQILHDFHGLKYGSTGSRLISGTSSESIATEAFLADYFLAEAALIFNSGYDANLGFFSCVPQKGDTVIYDELIHASIRDGLRLSHAKSYSFQHNDAEDLYRKLSKLKGTVYVAVESLYSMDGDFCPVVDVLEICENHGAYLIVDEAHAVGVIGKDGKGLVKDLGIEDRIFARLITFGKAYGSHGACILGDKYLINYLINFARSFIYTTALPPEAYSRIQQMISFPENDHLRLKLHQRIKYFREKLTNITLISDADSPIQIIEIGDIKRTIKIADSLQDKNIAVKPIFSPTVPEGKERLRICVHSFNTESEIDEVLKVLLCELN